MPETLTDAVARFAVELVSEVQSLRHRVNRTAKPGEEMRTIRVPINLVLVEEEGLLSDELREQFRLALEDIAIGAGAAGLYFEEVKTIKVSRDELYGVPGTQQAK